MSIYPAFGSFECICRSIYASAAEGELRPRNIAYEVIMIDVICSHLGSVT